MVKLFENAFANYCGKKYAIGEGNGFDALILNLDAYKELGIFKKSRKAKLFNKRGC